MNLIGDIGGTNARFALSKARGVVTDIKTLKARAYPAFSDALKAYLCGLDGGAQLRLSTVRLAAAGPIEPDGSVALTNSPWMISTRDVLAQTGAAGVELFNDLQAVALALPRLDTTDVALLGCEINDPLSGNRLAVNVGTGFGASLANALGHDRWTTIACEPGHMAFAARTSAEIDLIDACGSVEDVLSGSGLTALYANLARHGVDPPSLPDPPAKSAIDIIAAVATDKTARAAVDIFGDVLARVAGDLVLATGAWGGVDLTGSVAKAFAAVADQERFRHIFEEKGKMSARMARVPTRVITRDEPALFGLTFPDHGMML